MAGNSPLDHRHRGVFEHYLYDYFKKNNMDETAEIFRNEVNLTIDQITPHGVDVQDGFLHEWWHIFYDIFKQRYPITAQNNEGSSMANQAMNMGQQSDPSSSREHELNEEMIKELTVGSDIRIVIGGNLVPSTGSPSIKNEQVFEDSTSAEVQKKERTPSPTELPGQLGDIVAQKTENIASNEGGDALPEMENLLDMFYVEEDPKESGAKINNSVNSKDERSGIKLVSYSSSETSSPISSPFDGIVDEGGASSIEVSTPCTSVNSDGSNAPTVEESEKKR